MSWTLRVIGAVVIMAVGIAAAEASGFVVVVNSGNSITSITKDELGSMYLKRKTHWRGGEEVMVIDQKPSSEARDAFLTEVLGRDAVWVNNHWQKMVFTGRGAPPPTAASDREVLDLVRAEPGAVGFVAAGTTLGSGVKAIEVRD